MQHPDRRRFLKTGTLFSASTLASSVMGRTPTGTKPSPEINYPEVDTKKQTRTLGSGKHQIEVAYGMGLGCMGMSWNRSFVPDKKEMIALIRKAYEMGVDFFDTAEAYGPFKG